MNPKSLKIHYIDLTLVRFKIFLLSAGNWTWRIQCLKVLSTKIPTPTSHFFFCWKLMEDPKSRYTGSDSRSSQPKVLPVAGTAVTCFGRNIRTQWHSPSRVTSLLWRQLRECRHQRWPLGVQQPLGIFIPAMYSVDFNPFKPFRSITSCANKTPDLDTCCAKNTLILVSLLNLPPRTWMFYPKSFYSGKEKTITPKWHFQCCSGLNRVPHCPFSWMVSANLFTAPSTEAVPHLWSVKEKLSV